MSVTGGVLMTRKFLTIFAILLAGIYASADFASAQIRFAPQTRSTTNQQQNSNNQRLVAVPGAQGASAPQSAPGTPNLKSASDSAGDNITGKNYAVLIGVMKYLPVEKSTDQFTTLTLSDLKFCVDDMKELKAALIQSKYAEEQNIKLLVTTEDTTLENVLKVLKDYGNSLGGNDNILVAFSGHGVSLAPENAPEKKDDYFCCSNARIVYDRNSNEFQNQGLLSLKEMNGILENSKCKSKIIITDACRNIVAEESLRKSAGDSVTDAVNFPLRNMIRGLGDSTTEQQKDVQGFFRIASCGKDEISFEPTDLKHGVFSYSLINGLKGAADKNGDGIITLMELFDYTRTQTSDYVRTNIIYKDQRPTLSVLEGTGDFVIGTCTPTESEQQKLQQMKEELEQQKQAQQKKEEELKQKEQQQQSSQTPQRQSQPQPARPNPQQYNPPRGGSGYSSGGNGGGGRG